MSSPITRSHGFTLHTLLVAGAIILVATAACSSTTTTPGTGGGGGGTSGGAPGNLSPGDTCTGLPAECSDCTAFACPCNDGASVPTCACADSTCLDVSYCQGLHACDDHGGPVSDRPPTGRDAGKPTSPTACIRIGNPGCNSLNNPSNCCTDANRPQVVCNGNNDGNDHAQCCVNAGDPCVTVSDCCGYAGASATTKPYYSCTAGVCRFL